MNDNHKELAHLGLRLGMGINLFLHGVVRFGPNWDKFQDGLLTTFSGSLIPPFLIQATGHIIPVAEFILGSLLILGFKTKWATFGSTLLFLLLMTGMSTLQKWDVVGLHMSYLLFSFFLLFWMEHNHYSLDRKLRS